MQPMHPEQCLILFVKYPEKGQVKTRLARFLGEERAACLYRAFIEDLLERLSQGDYRFRIEYDPSTRKDEVIRMFGPVFSYLPQIGSDLGEKMANAFYRCFNEHIQQVVLIGSDSPDLPDAIIKEAFLALENHEAVIGPAYDGGYYLIGFQQESFHPPVFEGIAWSTDGVFAETMQRLLHAGKKVHVLPFRRDIDTQEDLMALVAGSDGTSFSRSRTMACLEAFGWTAAGRSP